MPPSINCERGHLTRNSCFKYSRWHCAHRPLLPLGPGPCLSPVGCKEEVGGGVPNGRKIDVDTTGLGSNVFLMVPTCLLSVCAGSILYLEGLAQSLTALGFGFEVYLIPVTEWQS